MKVAIYCDSSINGGHEEMLKRLLVASLSAPGVRKLVVMVPAANVALFHYARDLEVSDSRVRAIGLTYTAELIRRDVVGLWQATREAARTLTMLRPSKLIVSQGTIASGVAGVLAGRFAGVETLSYLPLVDDGPTSRAPVDKLKWLGKLALYRMPDQFVTLSEELRQKLLALVPHRQTMVIENYVDDRFTRSDLSKSAARAKLGLPADGTTVIAQIGRIDFAQKRQDFLMEAIERHANKFRHTTVLIVGEGPDAPRLNALVAASPVLSGCVRIVGATKDVLPYIIASDALALPSAFEGVPLVMIEAVLAERPIVASRVSGLDAYLPNELLFPAGDHDAMVQRLLAAGAVPMARLADMFQSRFSRKAFEERVHNLVAPICAEAHCARRR